MRRALTLILVLVSALSVPRLAEGQAGWATFVEPTFGTRITYPSALLPVASPFEGGMLFAGSSARLEVSAVSLPEIQSIDELLNYVMSAPGYEAVTYAPRGLRWLVLSGYRGELVFYEKFFLTGGVVHAFAFEYPVAERNLFDPVVEVLEDSFRPG